MPLVAESILALFLLGLSGLFSGLTLGLLGLDVYSLQISLASHNAQSQYAAKILPIRKRGNLLLCTLLFANVTVNAALPILLTRLFGEVGSLLMSISLIVIIGEIIPQAVCCRHALLIGAYSINLVYILVVIFFPVAYPISKALDFMLGDEIDQIYTRKELQKLIEMHYTTNHGQKLHKEEFNIMTGALQFGAKTVREIMTPLSAVFSLDVNACLDFETMQSVFESGYSRIPVMDCQDGKPNVVGILYAKDLILVDPDDALPISHVLCFYCRTVHFVHSDTKLERMFSEFKSGRTHIAIVVDNISHCSSDSNFDIRGLVTLEDIPEDIFQDSIYDETDVAVASPRQRSSQWLTQQPFVRQQTLKLQGSELEAVFTHFPETRQASFQALPNDTLRKLLQDAIIYEVVVASDFPDSMESRKNNAIDKGGLSLYKRGQELSFISIVLMGRVHVQFEANQTEATVGRWSVLGLPQLEADIKQTFNVKDGPDTDEADFTAYVVESSRICCIDRTSFCDSLRSMSNASCAAICTTTITNGRTTLETGEIFETRDERPEEKAFEEIGLAAGYEGRHRDNYQLSVIVHSSEP